uniref:VWFA domain-containing protein n=1 Tax=Acrobeloides nanus TaxID=290746 RepID=A0A914EKF4_9BILA
MVITCCSSSPSFSNKYSAQDVPGTLCSSNVTNAYVDIYLIFDLSSNTDANKLRQITLSLASELSQLQIAQYNDQGQVWHRSRVSIITYASTSNAVGNITTYNSLSDVTSALLSLKVSNDSSTNGLNAALQLAYIMNQMTLSNIGWHRNPLYIIFSSSINGMDTALITKYTNFNACWFNFKSCAGSLSTVNMNPKDSALTSFLSSFMTPSMNFSATDPNLYKNLEWAISQANCECGTYQNFAFDTTTQRWTLYADCYDFTYNFDESDPIRPGSTADSTCASLGREAAAYTFAMQNTPRINWFNYIALQGPDNFVPSSYIGLHRNSQNSWMWYDYDGSEFPLGNYQPWANGFNASSPGNCVLAVNNGTWQAPLYWQPASCLLTNTAYNYTFPPPHSKNVTNYMSVNCQSFACDADLAYNCGWSFMDALPNNSSQQVKTKTQEFQLHHIKTIQTNGKSFIYGRDIHKNEPMPKLFQPMEIKL